MTETDAPVEEAAIAAIVAEAAARRAPLAIVGRGTKAPMLRPVQAARGLSTRNHAGMTLHAPKELVLAARAGTPMAEIEATLAAAGQYMIAEPPDLSDLLGTTGAQTLGGAVAANVSGPRRVAWGAMRDHVIGVRAVNGTGEVIRSGGRVLKNVTGLDLCKLFTGSHGTLAVLTEITVKVLPAPERSGTLALPGLDAEAGVRALSAALGSPFSVSGAAWLPEAAASRVPELAGHAASVALIRIEDFDASVTYRIGALREQLGGEAVGDEASKAIWRAVRDVRPLPQEPSDAVWRVSVRPSAGPGVLRRLVDGIGARGFLDWGGGLVWIAASADAEAHAAVEQAARAAGGTWTVLRAPEPLRVAIDVVTPEVPILAGITRRVKAALDPQGILNPGRIYAGV